MRKVHFTLAGVALFFLAAACYLCRPLERPAADSEVGTTVVHTLPMPTAPLPAVDRIAVAPPPQARGIQVFDRPGQEPSWALAYGNEFWRASALPVSAGTMNFGPAIERVKHSFAADKRPLDVKGSTFAVELDGRGFRFSPFLPAATGEAPKQQQGVALHMETASIRAGNTDLYRASSAPIDWSINGNVAQGLLSPENRIVEHYDVRSDGVSVTWVMNQKPKTAGDVEIRWRYDGLRMGGSTASGHHFYDSNGKSRVRVGHATAVDSRGKSIPLRTEARGNALVVSIPQSVIDNAGYPLAIDPTVSAEFELDAPVLTETTDVLGDVVTSYNGSNWLVLWKNTTTFDLYGVTVASDGSPQVTNALTLCVETGDQISMRAVVNDEGNWMVTWEDGRSGNSDIYGALVSGEGRILTAENGFAINVESGVQSPRALAAYGSQWLAVWRSGSTLYGMIIGADGTLQLADKVQLGTNFNVEAVLAAVGNGYYLAWRDNRGGGNFDIYGTFVSTAGTPTFPTGEIVVSASGTQSNLAIVSTGSTALLGWADTRSGNSDLYGKLIGPDGTLGAEFVIVDQTSAQGGLSLAWNGTDFFAAWTDTRSGLNDIYGTLISSAGVVATEDGLVICDETANQSEVTVAGVGSQFLIAWQDQRSGVGDIYGAVISAAGVVQQTDGFAICDTTGAQVTPVISPCVADALVTWRDTNTGSNIFAASVFLDATVSPADGKLISGTANTEENLAVAAADDTWFVAWEDNRNSATSGIDIYGMKVDSNGEPISTDGIVISDATGDQTGPAIGSNVSNEFLVAWVNAGATVYGAILDENGVPLQEDGFLIHTPPGADLPLKAYVTANGGDDWLTWYTATGNRHYGAIVDPDAVITALSGSITSSDGIAPSAAGSVDKWLVVFRQSDDIKARLISADGNVSSLVDICTATGEQDFPAVAFNGTDWFVAWADRRVGEDVYGALVASSGTVTTTDIPICTDASIQDDVDITAAGVSFLAVWRDFRNDADGEIFGAFLNTSGTVQQANGFSISGATEGTVDDPRVTAKSDLAWVAWEEDGKVASAEVALDASVTDLGSTDGDAALGDVAFGKSSNFALAAFNGTNGDGFQHWTGTGRAAAQAADFRASQTILFTDVPDQAFTSQPITLTATASSGLPVTFSVVSGPGSINGNQLTLSGIGEVVLTAFQAGDADYLSASETQTVVISTRSQTISFAAIPTKNFSEKPFSLFASSNRGLGVSFRVLSGPARVSGNRLTMTDLGTVRVQAFNSGNATIAAASTIESFKIVDTTDPHLTTDRSVRTDSDRTKLEGKVTDNHRAKEVKYRIKPPGGSFGRLKTLRLGGSSDTRRFDLSISTPEAGEYVVKLVPLDEAGNKGASRDVVIQRN